MTKAEQKTELRRNGYDDDDFRSVISEMEEMDEEAEHLMSTARGKVQNIRKRQKNRVKIAKAELGIPSDVLNAVLKQRKLERKLEKLAAEISDDMVEVYEDAAGQFSLFKASEGEPAIPTAQAAARKAAQQSREDHEAEQAEGQAALDELAGKEAVH
ncbi:hypothetical protein [Pelagibacterium lentulum]|uniref:Uncharacterized protein n=1 Tax=Pelagibacterium lentulum TaxID=2029865 RepID=A0A916RQ87_9HYPH|nr:hypothetical protein [Pelagibacterium lentulum]GGA64728.1 hypothetical protein GCM10011499_38990 [Pelagibacterium lentulum]